MPKINPCFPVQRIPAALTVSPAAVCLLMAVLAFLLGICITLLLYHLHHRRASSAREDDSHEL